MRVDIGNNIKYYESWVENTLPQLSSNYESIILEQGRGQFLESIFEFDSEKILFQLKIDGEIIVQTDLEELKDFYEPSNEKHGFVPSVGYQKDGKLLYIKFPLPVQFSESIEFLAKTNDGNKTKKLKGYQVILNKEVG